MHVFGLWEEARVSRTNSHANQWQCLSQHHYTSCHLSIFDILETLHPLADLDMSNMGSIYSHVATTYQFLLISGTFFQETGKVPAVKQGLKLQWRLSTSPLMCEKTLTSLWLCLADFQTEQQSRSGKEEVFFFCSHLVLKICLRSLS